jgi:hypothetical protein
MAEPNEHLRSLLAVFDDALSEIQQLIRLSSAPEADVAQFANRQSPLALVGRLQQAIPVFEQARAALGAERDRARARLEETEGALAAVTAAPRPIPGSREEWAIATAVRQAERASEQAGADLQLAEARLGVTIAWDDLHRGLGRVGDVAIRRYAAYLRDVHLAEALATLRHAALRVVEARAVYVRTDEDLSGLARGHLPTQLDLVAPALTAALAVLLQAPAGEPTELVADGVDRSRQVRSVAASS